MKNKMGFERAGVSDVIGSSFAGYLEASFKDLVEKLGEPHWCKKEGVWKSRDQKVRAEWAFKLGTGKRHLVFTIYDYKEVRPVEDVWVWHIGAKGDRARLVEIFAIDKLSLTRGTVGQGEPE